MQEKTLAIGVTVGLRKAKVGHHQYFDTSLKSLRAAGFTEAIHAFCEPGVAKVHVLNPKSDNVVIHSRKKNLGCYQNFRHGLKHMMKHVKADWYLMLQDDCIWRADSSKRIHEVINDPDQQGIGMMSFYTSGAMVPKQEKKRDKKAKGHPVDRIVSCAFYNKAFWGAVALAFPHDAAAAMDAHPRYTGHKHQRKLDVVIGNVLRRELKLDIRMHIPSLGQHIGAVSTYGRHKIKGNQWGRRGYGFREE